MWICFHEKFIALLCRGAKQLTYPLLLTNKMVLYEYAEYSVKNRLRQIDVNKISLGYAEHNGVLQSIYVERRGLLRVKTMQIDDPVVFRSKLQHVQCATRINLVKPQAA